jgi:hypothetical protein
MSSNVVYQHVPKTGAVFMYQAEGLFKGIYADSFAVYRAGRTTKQHQGDGELVDFIGKLGQGGGLNRPFKVLAYLEVTDVEKSWAAFREFLRSRVFLDRDQTSFKQQSELGDNWYSAYAGPEQLEKYLKELLPKILNKWT